MKLDESIQVLFIRSRDLTAIPLDEEVPPVASDPPPALELARVVKAFGAVVALRSGTIAVHRGSIHALSPPIGYMKQAHCVSSPSRPTTSTSRPIHARWRRWQ